MFNNRNLYKFSLRSRILFSILIMVGFLVFPVFKSTRVFAQSYTNVQDACNRLSQDVANDALAGESYSPIGIACVLGRMFNLAIFLIGTVAVTMVLIGASRYSLSTGDPKRMETARNTWLFALLGAGIVLGFYTFYRIIASIFDLPVLNMGNSLVNMLVSVLNLGDITGY